MVPSAFSMMLESLVVEMEMVDLLTLHQLIMDTNSGPAINLLVQVITPCMCSLSLITSPECLIYLDPVSLL